MHSRPLHMILNETDPSDVPTELNMFWLCGVSLPMASHDGHATSNQFHTFTLVD